MTTLRAHFDRIAAEHERWRRKNRYYRAELERLLRFLVPPGQVVVEVGCGTGDLLAAVAPRIGIGIDLSPALRALAGRPIDVVILSDLVGHLDDVWGAMAEVRRLCGPRTRIIVTYYNFVWEPVLRAAEALRLKMPTPPQNWLGARDLVHLCDLAGLEPIQRGERLLLPKWVPGLSWLANRVGAKLPGLRHLACTHYLVARRRPVPGDRREASVSVVIPCRNEAGNIAGAVARTPAMGTRTELIFVDGRSTDGTIEKIEAEIVAAKGTREIRLIHQGDGRGKGDAVRKGFAAATGEILMILDADLTVPPEDLPRFYETLVSGQGEFVMGSRLIYPMERQAMRFLNMLGNKAFSQVFTWLLDQRIKDTLCGTKVLTRQDYQAIVAGRSYFGEFDPFGDFDLIFGAAKLNRKIVEIPIRYRERTYGETKISRWRHGWLLLQMCLVALRRLKLQ